MLACTIIAKNYAAHARVLAKSFLEHNPGSRITALILDDLDGLIDPTTEPFAVLTPEDVGCKSFGRMAARYDVRELSAAVRPWLLRHQLAGGAPAITYLDPDIRVFGSLEALDRQAREHGVAVTPHNTVPIPDDGERPTQVEMMLAGAFNLGCLSLSQRDGIDHLLDWWSTRVERDGRSDPVYGEFVDQRWFDLVPGFVDDLAIVREPQYNVAYWNLHSRGLELDGDSYVVDGRPLAFFHFSGFDPARPDLLSRRQTRIDLAQHGALRVICAEYANSVRAEGYAVARTWPYTYDRLADGTLLTRDLRRLYARAEDEGAVAQSPFEQSGCDAFLTWVSEQIELESAVVPELRPRLERGPWASAQSPSTPRGRLRSAAMRLMRPFVTYQTTVNSEVLGSLEALNHELRSITATQLRMQAELEAVAEPLAELSRRFEFREAEAQAIPYMSGTPFVSIRHPVAGVVQGYRADSADPTRDTYRSFEDVFRGPEKFIRDRQRTFVTLIGDREPVLDFGCGRGEFLDLLREGGRSYLGVDSDAGMVDRCKAKGHDQVTLADGLEFLAELDPDSLGALFCAQVIEHLTYEQVVRFFSLARRVLADDGLLIAETVNPHSAPALKTFWVDLTHQHPVFPEVALALCRAAGFGEAFIFHPNGIGDVETDRFTQGEYAVCATPRAGATSNPSPDR